MVMTADEVDQYCLSHPETQAMIVLEDAVPQKDRILRYGL
jgi:hypothetical protein